LSFAQVLSAMVLNPIRDLLTCCEYLDTTIDPHVERAVRWPHPAPESTARACLSIISKAIAKSDTGSYCNIYP